MELTMKSALVLLACANGALGNNKWVRVGPAVNDLAAKSGGNGGGGMDTSINAQTSVNMGLGPSDRITDYETELITETIAITRIIDGSTGGADCATGPGAELAQINVKGVDITHNLTAVQEVIDALNCATPGVYTECPDHAPVSLLDYSLVENACNDALDYTTILVTVPAGACWNETLRYWGSKEFYEEFNTPPLQIFDANGRPLNQGNAEGCPDIAGCISKKCFTDLFSDDVSGVCLQCGLDQFQSANLTTCEAGPCPDPDPDCFGQAGFCGYSSVYNSFNVTAGSGEIVPACISTECCVPMPVPDNLCSTIVQCKGDCQAPPPPPESPSPTPAPSESPSTTPSSTPSASVTPSATQSPSLTSSPTQTPSTTPSASMTPSSTTTPSITPSATTTPSTTPSNTPTPSITPSATPSPQPVCYQARNAPDGQPIQNAPLDARCGEFCVLNGVLSRTGDPIAGCLQAQFDAEGDPALSIRSLASTDTITVAVIGFANQGFDPNADLSNIIVTNPSITFTNSGVTQSTLDTLASVVTQLTLDEEANIPAFTSGFFDNYSVLSQVFLQKFPGNFVFDTDAFPNPTTLTDLGISDSGVLEINLSGLPTVVAFDLLENNITCYTDLYVGGSNAITELILSDNLITSDDFPGTACLTFPGDLNGTPGNQARLLQRRVFTGGFVGQPCPTCVVFDPSWYNNLCNVELSLTQNTFQSSTGENNNAISAARACTELLAHRATSTEVENNCGGAAVFTCTA